MCEHGPEPPPRSVHDRAELVGLLGRDPALNAYQLGDLDDFFWPYTSWFRDGDSVALVYHGGGLPILLAFEPPDRRDRLAELLTGLAPLLPRRLYAHLSPGAEAALAGHFAAESHGPHRKLALTEPARLRLVEPAGEPLTAADLPELLALYQLAYPDNSFDPRMLATGHYLGLRRAGELVAVAGVHVWSARYRVSALGNVTTHPQLRGQGIGTALVAGVCRRLLRTVDHVTLNVKVDNAPALALYARLGFSRVAEYTELTLTATA